jgi:hypothetical protein
MPGQRLTAWLRPLLTLAALAGVLSLAACGGGNGSPSQVINGGTATPLTITPSTATTYSGNAFTFTVTGGTPPYTILSSDQAVLPVVGTLDGSVLVVVPGLVGADTTVTLTVRDTRGLSTSAAVIVKPALLLPNSISITGNPACSSSGGTLCSGQNGTASVLVTGPAGAPLAGRQVRFDVVQGDFSFVNPAGQQLVSSLTVTSDQNGFAVVKLQVPTSATTQIATIRATDVTSGNAISSNFTIVAFNNGAAVLSVSPTAVSVPGTPHDPPQCAIGIPVTYYVFGGTPPYTVAANLPTLVSITGAPVANSGGGFTVRANACADEVLTITDASGRFITASFASVLGPAATTGGGTGGTGCSFSPTTGCPIVTPSSVTLASCGAMVNPTITGGTPPYTTSSPSGITAIAPGSSNPVTLTITRTSDGGTVPASPATVTVSSGSLATSVTVTLTGAAAASCP